MGIEVSNLTKNYGSEIVLENLDLNVPGYPLLSGQGWKEIGLAVTGRKPQRRQ